MARNLGVFISENISPRKLKIFSPFKLLFQPKVLTQSTSTSGICFAMSLVDFYDADDELTNVAASGMTHTDDSSEDEDKPIDGIHPDKGDFM